jgi:actin-related protein 8
MRRAQSNGRLLIAKTGLERTDNNMDLSTWPQVPMINQKNYYTEFLKRDEQFLAVRYPKDEERARIVQEARDKDRARALGVPQAAEGTTPQAADETAEDADMSFASRTDISKLIVIHPGSQNLRIGLGSDALPKTIPMVIARRWKESECEEEGGEPSPKRLKLQGAVPAEALPEKWFGEDFADQYMAMSSELRTRMRQNKRRVLPNSKDLVINYNRRTPPDIISEHNDMDRIDWTELPRDASKAPDFFTGHAALRIPENSKPRYKLFWPIRHGTFNEKDYVDRNQIYHDLSKILEEAFKNQLGIKSMKDLVNYKCVFIIPDLYERQYVTMILDVLIRDLGLGKVCLQQESLSASFGAGYGVTCVVDIGAQKTSICCVDEGLCVEESRVNLKMGGSDVTETFIKMMLYGHFPYSDMNLKRRYDFLLAEELKQKFCSMDEGSVTVQTWDFHLRASGQDTRKYTFKTYDETMLSVMVSRTLFNVPYTVLTDAGYVQTLHIRQREEARKPQNGGPTLCRSLRWFTQRPHLASPNRHPRGRSRQTCRSRSPRRERYIRLHPPHLNAPAPPTQSLQSTRPPHRSGKYATLLGCRFPRPRRRRHTEPRTRHAHGRRRRPTAHFPRPRPREN